MARRSPTMLSFGLMVAVLRQPDLWLTALRQALRMIPDRWWSRRPFLPVPDASYMRFRVVTAYGGDGTAAIDPADLVTYLRWCRTWPG